MSLVTQESINSEKLEQFGKELATNKELVDRANKFKKKLRDEQERQRPVLLTGIFPGLKKKESK